MVTNKIYEIVIGSLGNTRRMGSQSSNEGRREGGSRLEEAGKDDRRGKRKRFRQGGRQVVRRPRRNITIRVAEITKKPI